MTRDNDEPRTVDKLAPDDSTTLVSRERFEIANRTVDTYTFWPRQATGIAGDRLTVLSVNGRGEIFVLLTSSPDRGHDVHDILSLRPGIGEPIDITREELVRFAQWVMTNYATPDEIFGSLTPTQDDDAQHWTREIAQQPEQS